MSAILSVDGRYRYTLTREWDDSLSKLVFVMLNPSTADAELDDPTIRRCIGFAKREGFGGLRVVNLYAYRATDPRELKRCIDPVGPDNDMYLTMVFADAPVVVAAWGVNADSYRVRQVRKMLGDTPILCLGATKAGHPQHPLYIAGNAPLRIWPPKEVAA